MCMRARPALAPPQIWLSRNKAANSTLIFSHGWSLLRSPDRAPCVLHCGDAQGQCVAHGQGWGHGCVRWVTCLAHGPRGQSHAPETRGWWGGVGGARFGDLKEAPVDQEDEDSSEQRAGKAKGPRSSCSPKTEGDPQTPRPVKCRNPVWTTRRFRGGNSWCLLCARSS